MSQRNENSQLVCRFLSDEHLVLTHQKFVEAFSDYSLPFKLSLRQFENHIVLNNVDLNRSVGCFDKENLVGLSLNGFGHWKGDATVYDAGTGVVPDYRRRGISKAMFEMMCPHFSEHGFEQYLLEVITENTPAVELYKKLGFKTERELLLLETQKPIESVNIDREVEIRRIFELPEHLGESHHDSCRSWQNSPEAIDRTMHLKKILGAFENDVCVGYVVYTEGFSRISQMLVDRNFRKRGIGTRLLIEMQNDDGLKDNLLRVINLDASDKGSTGFFERRGLRRVLSQFEMYKPL